MNLRAKSAKVGALLIAAAGLLGASDTALAATTQIGSVDEIAAGALPAAITSGGFGVQISEATGTYAVPPGYTSITSWSHSAGTTAGTLTFKVYRPTGALHEFLVVGSDTEAVSAGSVQSFPVQIAVQPGDRIGLSSDDVELAYQTFDINDQIGFFGGDLAVGTTRATDGDPFPDFKLDVAATLSDGSSDAPADPGAVVPPAPAPVAPKLTLLSLSPAAFAAARSGSSTRSTALHGFGTRVRYAVDRDAKLRFSIQRVTTGRRTGRGAKARCLRGTKSNRSKPRCTRYVSVGAFTASARASGAASLNFTGRLAGRTLAPGSYRLTATPSAAGLVGNSVTRTFRVVRGHAAGG